ncbi:MAG: hypothetical protein DI570_11015 [Phenylobacterium zucineum]|nr:MAG: hypothetical protein DI570_11015 [Phenylobacterium zucineum]
MRTFALTLLAAAGLAACGGKPAADAGQPADTASIAPAAVASALTLDANNLPKFREGLWEAVQTEDGESETSQHCVGPEIDAELREMLTRETPDCQTQRSATPAGLKIDAVCNQAGGLKTETKLVLTGSETNYDMKLGIYLVKPDGARDGGETQVKAKWVGACPAGMKPGDEVEK